LLSGVEPCRQPRDHVGEQSMKVAMEIKVNYPMMARAIRKGIKGECRLLASADHRHDVPEVSGRETEQVTSSAIVYNHVGKMASAPPLRIYADRLYRFIAPLHRGARHRSDDLHLYDVTARAFGDGSSASHDYLFTSLGKQFCDKRNRSPLARPVFGVFRDRLEAMAMNGTHGRNRTFPKGHGWNGYEPNEDEDFHVLAGSSQWISTDDVEESLSMQRRQSERLLVIDEGLWYETKPPCIAVEAHWQKYRPTESSVIVSYRYLPDAMDMSPSTRYFPLSALAQARESAERLRSEFRMKDVVDKVVDFDFVDHETFEFDTVENLVTRTGHALSLSLLNYRAIRPDKIDENTEAWLAGLSEEFHSFNPVLGVEVDFASRLPAIVENYLALDAPKCIDMQKYQKTELRKILPGIVDMLDDMPVAVHGLGVAPSFSP
jgi:hypothetical protein